MDAELVSSSQVNLQQIEAAVDRRQFLIRRQALREQSTSSRKLFIGIASAWFKFLRKFEEPPEVRQPFAQPIESFVEFMRDERGLSPVTITTRSQQINLFMESVWHPGMSLSKICIKDIDAYLIHQAYRGWSRAS